MIVVLYARYEPEEIPFEENGIPVLELIENEHFDTFDDAIRYIKDDPNGALHLVKFISKEDVSMNGGDIKLLKIKKTNLIDGNKVIYDEIYDGELIQRFEFVAYDVYW